MTAARRTDSSYPDYLASTNPSGLIIQPNSNGTQGKPPPRRTGSTSSLLTELRHLPHVRRAGDGRRLQRRHCSRRAAGTAPVLFTQVQLVASSDGMFARQDRLTIVQPGARPSARTRWWRRSRAAATLHLHVGSRLPVGIWASSPAAACRRSTGSST